MFFGSLHLGVWHGSGAYGCRRLPGSGRRGYRCSSIPSPLSTYLNGFLVNNNTWFFSFLLVCDDIVIVCGVYNRGRDARSSRTSPPPSTWVTYDLYMRVHVCNILLYTVSDDVIKLIRLYSSSTHTYIPYAFIERRALCLFRKLTELLRM